MGVQAGGPRFPSNNTIVFRDIFNATPNQYIESHTPDVDQAGSGWFALGNDQTNTVVADIGRFYQSGQNAVCRVGRKSYQVDFKIWEMTPGDADEEEPRLNVFCDSNGANGLQILLKLGNRIEFTASGYQTYYYASKGTVFGTYDFRLRTDGETFVRAYYAPPGTGHYTLLAEYNDSQAIRSLAGTASRDYFGFYSGIVEPYTHYVSEVAVSTVNKVQAPYISNSTTNTQNIIGTTSITLDKPSGTQVGDLLIASVGFANGSALGAETITMTSWTMMRSGGQNFQSTIAFYRIADGTEASTLTVAWSATDAKASGVMLQIRGHHPSQPFEFIPPSGIAAASATPTTADFSIPTFGPDRLLLGFTGGDDNDSSLNFAVPALPRVAYTSNASTPSTIESSIMAYAEVLRTPATYSRYASIISARRTTIFATVRPRDIDLPIVQAYFDGAVTATPNTVQPGNTLIFAVASNVDNAGWIAPAGYTKRVSTNSGSAHFAVYDKIAGNAEAPVIRIREAGNDNNTFVHLLELKGPWTLEQATPLSINTGGQVSHTPTTTAPNQDANELALGYLTVGGTIQNISWTNGFQLIRGTGTTTGNRVNAVVKQVLPRATPISTAITWLTARGSSSSAIMVYKKFDILKDITWYHAFYAEDPLWHFKPANGIAVNSWRNAGSNATPATNIPGFLPFYRSSYEKMNRRPVIQSDSALDQYLRADTASTLAQPFYVVAIGSFDKTTAACLVAYPQIRATTGTWEISAGSAVTGGTADKYPHLFVAYFNDTESYLEVDGVRVLQGTAGTDGSSSFGMFRTVAGLNKTGDSLAFAGMTSSLSDDQKARLLQWTRDYYGVK